MSQDYILYLINKVTERINKEKTQKESEFGREISFDEYSAIALDCIYKKGLETGVIDREDQYLIGAILGNMFHQAYRETRKLDKPDKNGFMYNPREKELNQEIDGEFVQYVLDGKIPQSKTLYVRDGKVYMDIANTEFANLSPYWKKDNFGAGKCATMAIITNWKGLSHDLPVVRDYVTIAVASDIHNNWIARDNVYRDVAPDGKVYTNEELDTAYIYLIDEEKAKDLVHVQMASRVIGKLVDEISKVKANGNGEKTPEDQEESQPQ